MLTKEEIESFEQAAAPLLGYFNEDQIGHSGHFSRNASISYSGDR